MARKPEQSTEMKPSPEWAKWSERMAKADRVWSEFCKRGTSIVDRYRLERNRAQAATNTANANNFWQDKYNILYSSTETMRPSLYAQTPKPQVDPRVKDTDQPEVLMAATLMESCLHYAIDDLNLDEVMENVVGDYLLPGFGNAWVRYGADFIEDGEDEYIDNERFELDYIHFKDFRCSGGRTWKDVWWVAKRCYLFPEQAKKRFGTAKAKMLSYSHQQEEATTNGGKNVRAADADQAAVWEIWCKRTRKIIWWSNDCKDILDEKDDPLKLKNFFPCPKPLRAVHTTDTFIPTSFYSQYRQQAEALDDITMRIRILSKALRLVGVYDQSQDALSRLLSGTDNKMVGVENWAQFAGTGGMNGSVQYLPIKDIAAVLSELYKQREIAKNEIYEITGFSDITRGLSKASETLGAQEIKNQWAGGRLRMLQKEVQRFCRDIIAIMGEVIAEQFSDASIALYSGFTPPPITPEEQQQLEQVTMLAMQGQQAPPVVTQQQQAVAQFKQVVALLRNDKSRCAKIDIETDSTIQPDEAAERKDRMDFLGAMGAYLQQAGPMAMQFPEMRGLLGAMMMFTARTFRASRPIEKEFEQFQKALLAAPPMDPNGKKEGGDDGQAKLAAEQLKQQGTMQVAQMKQQTDQAKVQADERITQMELQAKGEMERYRIDREMEYKASELALREREVAVKEAELGLKRDDQAHEQALELEGAAREDERLELDAKVAERPPAGEKGPSDD
jgi:hypothetical protein